MNQRLIHAKAIVAQLFKLPHQTPRQGEDCIKAALTLCAMGCLNDSQPVSVFAENHTLKLLRFDLSGQLDAFYEDLRQELQTLLTDHLAYRATDPLEVAGYEIIERMSRHERKACEKGRVLLDAHDKITRQAVSSSSAAV